jgi:arginine deiminase
MKSILELAYKKHSDWNNIVKSFGCNPSISEDVVQEMYIQLDADVKKGLDLYYKDQINHYYCYKVLRGIYTNLYKSSLRQKKVYLEDINELKQIEESGINEKEWAQQRDQLDSILNNMYWYDRKILEIIGSGMSVAELSRNTDIRYHSLYNTYTNAKKHIKNKL